MPILTDRLLQDPSSTSFDSTCPNWSKEGRDSVLLRKMWLWSIHHNSRINVRKMFLGRCIWCFDASRHDYVHLCRSGCLPWCKWQLTLRHPVFVQKGVWRYPCILQTSQEAVQILNCPKPHSLSKLLCKSADN